MLIKYVFRRINSVYYNNIYICRYTGCIQDEPIMNIQYVDVDTWQFSKVLLSVCINTCNKVTFISRRSLRLTSLMGSIICTQYYPYVIAIWILQSPRPAEWEGNTSSLIQEVEATETHTCWSNVKLLNL